MKQYLSIKEFYGHSEQTAHNQVCKMIVGCLSVLAQINTKSFRTYFQKSRYLKDFLGIFSLLPIIRNYYLRSYKLSLLILFIFFFLVCCYYNFININLLFIFFTFFSF